MNPNGTRYRQVSPYELCKINGWVKGDTINGNLTFTILIIDDNEKIVVCRDTDGDTFVWKYVVPHRTYRKVAPKPVYSYRVNDDTGVASIDRTSGKANPVLCFTLSATPAATDLLGPSTTREIVYRYAENIVNELNPISF